MAVTSLDSGPPCGHCHHQPLLTDPPDTTYSCDCSCHTWSRQEPGTARSRRVSSIRQKAADLAQIATTIPFDIGHATDAEQQRQDLLLRQINVAIDRALDAMVDRNL